MPVSKKQQACVSKYNKANYEEIKLRVKKGEKAKLQALSEQQGTSLNAFITTAISEYIKTLST